MGKPNDLGTEVDTTNYYMVSVNGDQVVILNQPILPLDPEEALVHAAWLVLLADPGRERWEEVLLAVANS